MRYYPNLDPTDWFGYLLFAAVAYAFIGHRWQFLFVVVGGILCWPYLVRIVREIFRAAYVRWRTSAASRKPGVLFCPDCGGELESGPADFFAATEACAACRGMWCVGARLQEGLAKKKPKTSRPWLPFPEEVRNETKPCPRCAAPMIPGSFSGVTAVTHRCHACDGYWSNRTGWLAFELWL